MSVALTMILFTLLYGALAVAEIKLTLRYAQRGAVPVAEPVDPSTRDADALSCSPTESGTLVIMNNRQPCKSSGSPSSPSCGSAISPSKASTSASACSCRSWQRADPGGRTGVDAFSSTPSARSGTATRSGCSPRVAPPSQPSPVVRHALLRYYLALALILVALILRGMGLDYRGKGDTALWRQRWDWCITGGSCRRPALGASA